MSQDLALAQTVSHPSLPHLLQQAVSAATVDYAARTVWFNQPVPPSHYVGLEEAIGAYDAVLVPATKVERGQCLAEMMLVLPPPVLEEEAHQVVRWAAYHRALDDLPADVLQGACHVCIRSLKFFPKPVEIRSAAAPILGPRLLARNRLAALRDFRIRVRGEDTRRTAEDLARRKKFVAEYRQRNKPVAGDQRQLTMF